MVIRGDTAATNYLCASPVLKSCHVPLRTEALPSRYPKHFMANSTGFTLNLSHRKSYFNGNNQQHLIYLNLPITVLILWSLRKSIHRTSVEIVNIAGLICK